MISDDEFSRLASRGDKTEFIRQYLLKYPSASGNEGASAFDFFKRLEETKGSSSFIKSAQRGTLMADVFGENSKIAQLVKLGDTITKVVGDQVGQYFESQLGKSGDEASSLKIFEIIKEKGLNLSAYGPEVFKKINGEILKQLKAESELRSEIATKTGLSGKLGETLREDMKTASIEAARYGVSLKEMGQFYIDLVDQTGRFNLINSQTYNQIIPLTTALDMNLSDFAKTIADFEKVGLGADKTISSLKDATTRSLSLGLSAKSITKGITENIEKLNSYGFKNGVEGLEKMVMRSKEFRFTMDQVFEVANKVFEPEGAIEMVANLQMIGGAIGDLNDPMRLLYMSTNDIEGLQEAIIGASGSIATYNEEQGAFEITGVNLRRAKAQADALGVSYTEFSKLAIAAAERSQAAIDLAGRGLDVDEKDKEFLTNLARMEDGEMKITIPKSLAEELGTSTKLSLKDMTDDIANQLLLNKKAFEDMTVEDIAMEQLTETQKMSRGIDVIAAYFRIRGTEMLTGAARGLGGEMYEKLQESIDEYSKVVEANSSKNIEKETEKKVRDFRDGYVKDPIGTVKKGAEYLWDNLMNENRGNTAPPPPQTIKHDVTLTFRAPEVLSPIMAYMARNPEVINDMIITNSGGYTSA